MQKGLSESLADRFETITVSHWGLAEMQQAFNFSLEEYIYFGGYPGSAPLIREESRWRRYVRCWPADCENCLRQKKKSLLVCLCWTHQIEKVESSHNEQKVESNFPLQHSDLLILFVNLLIVKDYLF